MNRQPSLFISHGAPTFAIDPGLAGAALARLGRSLPPPRAVLIVSPHWMTRTVMVGSSAKPATVHDFGGFPAALYKLQYPVAGSPELAQAAADLLLAAGLRVTLDGHRGLDHGAWVPLMHMYPQADVPAFQVSMPAGLDAEGAWQLGALLGPLREQGVMIIGSGSLTHNLYEFRQGHQTEEPYVAEFVDWMRGAVLSGDKQTLVHSLELAPHGRRAHPTTDHFLPLLVAAGAAAQDAPATVLRGDDTHGVLSMESYVFGDMVTEAALQPEPAGA